MWRDRGRIGWVEVEKGWDRGGMAVG
jgi:hypothetical protein